MSGRQWPYLVAAGDAPPPPGPIVCNPDAVTTAYISGGFAELDVIANDTRDPPGPAFALTSAGVTSGGGSTSIVAGRLRWLYTTAAAVGLIGAGIYGVSDGLGGTGSSTWQATITAAIAGRPEYPAALPAPAKQRVVGFTQTGSTTYSTIQAAYNAAADGDHVVVGDGVWAESLTLNTNHAIGDPVVIRARNPWMAELSLRTIIGGTGHWLHEFKFTWPSYIDDDCAVRLNSSYFWMTRCWLTSPQGFGAYLNGLAHHYWIGWNRFNGRSNDNPFCKHIFIVLPDGTSWNALAKGPRNVYIYSNFFYDNTYLRLDPDDAYYIYVGTSHIMLGVYGQVPEGYIEGNLIFSDIAVSGGRDRRRGFYLKRGFILRNNTCMIKGSGSDGFRHSIGGIISGNTFYDDISVNGGRPPGFDNGPGTDPWALVYGNTVGGNINLNAGYGLKNGTPEGPPHQAADYCRCIGNKKRGPGNLTINVGIGSADILEDGNALNPQAGGVVDHVTVCNGDGFGTTISRKAGRHDPLTVPATATDGWDGLAPLTGALLTPIQVGLRMADQR
jgi:hypothetical protein